MHRLHPSRHRGRLAAALGLLLCISLLPAASPALAQDEVTAAVTDAFEAVGVTGEAELRYAWTVTEPDAQWTFELNGPAGETVSLELRDTNRTVIERASGPDRAAIFDVALEPGSYTVEVPRVGGPGYPVELEVRRQVYRNDPEPNDRTETAAPLADGEPLIGRLARVGHDEDHFVLSVPAGDRQLRDIELRWDSPADRELCLMGAGFERRQCRRGPGAVTLADLALEPGRHELLVSGSVDENLIYELRVTPIGEHSEAFEQEPNDEAVGASPLDPAVGVHGTSSREDFDIFEVAVADEPQLWQVDLAGAEIDQLAWIRHGTDEVARVDGRCDGQPLFLTDLYLEPGAHQFRVRACAGEYDLTMTPLGPPDLDGEREPNSDPVRAEPYQLGQRRVGRLVSGADVDYFRFTVAAPTHAGLRLAPPADAAMDVRLSTGEMDVFRQSAGKVGGAGEPLALDLWLDPGEYRLMLRSPAGSRERYELLTELRSPYSVPVDAEPNDRPGFARPAPATLSWEAVPAGSERDLDAYWLPPLASAGPLRIEVGEDGSVVRLYSDVQANARVELEQDENGAFVAADPPVGIPLYLEVEAAGEHSVHLEASGWPSVPNVPDLPVAVELELEADTVAAYWPEAQRIAGSIRLDNRGSADLELELRTATSHFGWQLVPETPQVMVPAGGGVDVPASLLVAPDAWAGYPVLVSVAASAADGAHADDSVMAGAGRDAQPLGVHPYWALPEALLGGLNVAGTALGATPAGTVDLERELLLFDGVTPAGSGFGISLSELPLELVVDLAGEAPVPVMGTLLNPLARGSRLNEMVRGFELLLSDDGSTWTSVLQADLSRTPIEQAFVLEEPVLATHAMLRIHSLHGDGSGSYPSLGEWKVIASPGAVPDDMPANIADPVRGGHVARHEPTLSGLPAWRGLLDADPKRQDVWLDRDLHRKFELVVGFRDGRAAQVGGLRWHDPEGSLPEERVTAVEVAVSMDGPLGPWQSVGSWPLERAADGSVARFVPTDPVWARYVRLSGALPPEEVWNIEMPGQVEVLERATDDTYRSVLGEWGYASDRGPYEWLRPPETVVAAAGEDAGDTAATATLLALGSARSDRAEVGQDVDWYRVLVPPTDNTLTIDLEGVPTVGVTVTLSDAAGSVVPLVQTLLPGGGTRHVAAVEPGAAYELLVEQPPFNVVFTFDTSGSMGPYLDFVLEALRAFAGDIEPGRETAMIVPFERQPLLREWQDDPDVLVAAANGFMPANDSSNVERGLLAGAELLAERDGTRAILVVGDAETGTLDEAPLVWSAFEQTRPVVYAVHVGADTNPAETRDLMRSWAHAYGGDYSYPTTHAEMERSFERMSTRLRRPAAYTLVADTAFVDRTPGSVRVVAPPGAPPAVAPDVAVEIVLDTSGSMRRPLGGKRRINVAKASLQRLLRQTLPEGMPVALRTFGGGGSGGTRCSTQLTMPLRPLDQLAARQVVKGLRAVKRTQTPIAAALEAVAGDLALVDGPRMVVLITDGDETCGGDPGAVIETLRASGVEVNLNIVGFALEDEALKERMATWAEAGAGSYFDAGDAADLDAAVTTALSAPFRVYPAGEDVPVASGTVGGDPVAVDPGTYRVEVLTDPLFAFETVVVTGSAAVALELPPPPS